MFVAFALDTILPLTISDIKASCEDVAVTFKLNVRFSIMICTESANSIRWWKWTTIFLME